MNSTGTLNVLHITFDMGIGGTEQVIRHLIAGLDHTRYHNRILCIEGSIGAIGEQLISAGVECLTLQRRPGFDLSLVGGIRSITRTHRIDILHCHQYTPFVYGALAALGTSTQIIFTEHGRFHPDTSTWKRRLVNPLLNCRTDAVTAISEATRTALIEVENFPATDVDVIYNGIRPIETLPHDSDSPSDGLRDDTYDSSTLRRSLGLPPGQTVFGTISRFDSIKNQIMMLDALSSVIRKQKSVSLLLVGDGPERETLERRVEQLQLQSHVVFTGFQSQTAPYWSLIDVFVLSSLSEGTSITLLEAMSAAKPCIVTAVGGNVELIAHEQTGLIVPSGDTTALASAMQRLVDDDELGRKLGVSARKHFQSTFHLSHMIAAYSALYESLNQRTVR